MTAVFGANQPAPAAMLATSATQTSTRDGIYPNRRIVAAIIHGVRMPPISSLPLALALTLASAQVHPACTARSGSERPHLVELYTSEGCDSCPPAERWMSSLLKHPDLIGLEFHVDYWDGSDWRDPFSDHAYTARQQALAKRGNHDQIYTPQIWLDGRVWQNWPKGSPPAPVEGSPPTLQISAEPGSPLRVQVDAQVGRDAADYRVFAALSENSLSEHVRGGENRGKTLNHDTVVRALAGPFDLPHAAFELKIPARVELARASIVAFVQSERDGSIVQATRLSLGECEK
jgi:hypothetical protein